MSLRKKLAVKRPCYCSDINHYDRNSTQQFDSMSAFLAAHESDDPDLFLCFRWDVAEFELVETNTTGYRAEVYLIGQTRGKYIPCLIDSLSEPEAERFLAYAQKHWAKVRELWLPLTGDVSDASAAHTPV